MSERTGQDYYARRAAQERVAAERSGDEAARRIHHDLAGRYAELAQEPATRAID